jgi:hypothetical protein
MIEKRNYILAERMRWIAAGDALNWDKYVAAATYHLNYYEIDSLGFSLFQIIFSIDKRVILDYYRTEVFEAVLRIAIDEKVYENRDL